MANPSASTTDRPDFPPRLPVIGPYKAVRILGEGAMGVVYLAEQTRPLRRQVALKLIRPGLGSKQVVARFERERQALALMNHPHVARVYDAGETEDRRPYFVMEHVDGIPVTKYCDTHKLSNTERLHLFLKIGEAVQHAHQKGIIHRDIKPSNILVSGPREQPAPKVIDFGVAKAIGPQLTGDSFATQFGQFVGTPAYMSPEQANPMFEDVDIRSDVYSLGVLLYELISGVLPFDFTRCLEKGSLAEIQRMILEQEPSLPSTRFSSLGEEATTIADRHGTDVRHMRRELTDDLDSIVMQALEKDRPRRYATVLHFTQDIERHLRSEPVHARRQTFVYRARKFAWRRRRVIAVYSLLLSVCISAFAAGTSIWRARELEKEAIRAEFLEAQSTAWRYPQEAVVRWTKFLDEHPNDHDAKIHLAYSHLRENDIADSIKAAEQLLVDDPTNGPAHLLLALIYKDRKPELAQDHLRQGRMAVRDGGDYTYYNALASSDSAEAVSILTELLDKEGTHFDARWARAWRYFDLGHYDKMLEDAVQLTKNQGTSAPAWNAKGVALAGLDRFDDALDSFSRAIEIAPNATTYLNRAGVYFSQGDYAAALADCERAVARDADFADAYAYRALAQQKIGRPAQASADCETALKLQPRSATAHWVKARLLRQEGDLARAASEMNEALAVQPGNASFLLERGGILIDLQEYDAAFDDYSALCRQQETPEARHGRGIAAARLGAFDIALADFNRAIQLDGSKASYFGSRARLYRWMGDYSSALVDNDQAVALAPNSLDAHVSRGISRWLAGDLPGAVEDIENGLSIDARRGAPCLLWLWQIHQARGDAQAASGALRRAEELMSDPWQVRLIAVLEGNEAAEGLLQLAVDEPKRCEAHYYLGAKAAAHGGDDEARRRFQEFVNLGCKGYSEYDLALGLLAAPRG